MIDRLTPEQIRDLKVTTKKQLDEIKRAIDKAKRAGLDTTDLEATWQRYETLRVGLLREYGGRSGTVA